MKELKITKGEWSVPHFARPDVKCGCGFVLSEGYCGSIATVHYSTDRELENGDNPPLEEAIANAQLIAEAGTVANQCGLTPKELLEQRNELLKIAKHLAVNMKAYGNEKNGKRWFETIFKTKLSYLKENFDMEV